MPDILEKTEQLLIQKRQRELSAGRIITPEVEARLHKDAEREAIAYLKAREQTAGRMVKQQAAERRKETMTKQRFAGWMGQVKGPDHTRRQKAEQVAAQIGHGIGRGVGETGRMLGVATRAAAPHVWSATKEVASLTLGEVSAEARAFAEKQRAQRAIKRSPEWAETRATAEMTARVAREAESQKARAARHIESQRARTAEHAALVRARAAERLPATMPMRSVVERRLMERAGLRDMPEIYFGPQSVSPFGATPLGGRLPGTRPQPYAPDAWISPQQPMFVMSQQTPITIAPQFEQQMPVSFAPDITVDTDIESRPIVDFDLDFEIDLDQVLHSRRAATRRKAKPRATEQPQPGAGTLRLL